MKYKSFEHQAFLTHAILRDRKNKIPRLQRKDGEKHRRANIPFAILFLNEFIDHTHLVASRAYASKRVILFCRLLLHCICWKRANQRFLLSSQAELDGIPCESDFIDLSKVFFWWTIIMQTVKSRWKNQSIVIIVPIINVICKHRQCDCTHKSC